MSCYHLCETARYLWFHRYLLTTEKLDTEILGSISGSVVVLLRTCHYKSWSLLSPPLKSTTIHSLPLSSPIVVPLTPHPTCSSFILASITPIIYSSFFLPHCLQYHFTSPAYTPHLHSLPSQTFGHLYNPSQSNPYSSFFPQAFLGFPQHSSFW